MEITNGWTEVTLSVLRDITTLQNTTQRTILIKEASALPTDNNNAFRVEPMEVWTFIKDSTDNFYVNGLYVPNGEVETISVS